MVWLLLLDSRIQVSQQWVVGGLGLGVVAHTKRPKSLVKFIGLEGLVVNFDDISVCVQLDAVIELQKSKKFTCQLR